MQEKMQIINNIFAFAVLTFITVRVYHLFIGKEKISEAIIHLLQSPGTIIDEISKLNPTEQMKYGVPFPIFRIYNYFFGILSGEIHYVRKVTLSDKNNDEIVKYIELRVKRRKVVSHKEIDSFKF